MPQFTCTCGAVLDAPDELVGQQARCYACGELLVVPANAPVVPVLQAPVASQAGDAAAVFEFAKASVYGILVEDGAGSGFLIDDAGMVATNAHVVGRSRWVEMVLVDDSHVTAEVAHSNSDLDLAFVRADPTLLDGCRPLRLAWDSPPATGSHVFAIGNPRGLDHTLTSGVVSAARRVHDGREYVQTDTPINPGNSGGPLLDSSASVIGVVSWGVTGSDGLYFAIPADVLLAEYQRVTASLSQRPAGVYCNVCGNHSADIAYCDNCGTRIEPVPPPPLATEPQATTEAATAVSDRMQPMLPGSFARRCGACGTVVASGERYCQRCGSSA